MNSSIAWSKALLTTFNSMIRAVSSTMKRARSKTVVMNRNWHCVMMPGRKIATIKMWNSLRVRVFDCRFVTRNHMTAATVIPRRNKAALSVITWNYFTHKFVTSLHLVRSSYPFLIGKQRRKQHDHSKVFFNWKKTNRHWYSCNKQVEPQIFFEKVYEMC